MGYVLIVSCVFPPEPVVSANLSYDIAQKLHQEGGRIVVLSPKASRPQNYMFSEIAALLPFDHIIADSFVCPQSKMIGRVRESYSFGKATYKYIKIHREEIDVIYANTWPLFAQYYLAKAAKKYNIPYYVHIQDIYPESYCHKMPRILGKMLYRLLIPMDKYVLGNSKGVFAISPAMKNYLVKTRGLDDSKVLLVRNWLDDKAYIGAYKPIEEKHEKRHVMYLGSINPTANVSLIIKAIASLDKDKYILSIIGNGPEKDNCQELTKRLGVEATLGTVTPEKVAKTQGEADILVLCLKKGVAQTATPSKLTAYMLSGRPIVASVDLDSDCANIIREAGCGLVVEPENEQSLREAIKIISQKDTEELNRLGRAAFEYAKNHLSKDRNLNILVGKLING